MQKLTDEQLCEALEQPQDCSGCVNAPGCDERGGGCIRLAAAHRIKELVDELNRIKGGAI